MTYDFDALTDRSGTYSLKWEEAGDALPMWVADMDFQTAPPIREAMRRRLDHGVFGYSIVPDEWTDAYIGWWRDRHGDHTGRERGHPDAGVQHLLQLDPQQWPQRA